MATKRELREQLNRATSRNRIHRFILIGYYMSRFRQGQATDAMLDFLDLELHKVRTPGGKTVLKCLKGELQKSAMLALREKTRRTNMRSITTAP